MTEPSKAAIAKAVELMNTQHGMKAYIVSDGVLDQDVRAFAFYIDKVSEAVRNADLTLESNGYHSEQPVRKALSELILRDPITPTEEAWASANACGNPQEWEAELAKRGLKIVESDA